MPSDWKQSSIDRNDERHTKIQDDVQKPHTSKKNTKKWCKGKKGKEHTPECMTYKEAKGETLNHILGEWRFLVCTTCGKELEIWYGPKKLFAQPKPDWVDR
jgi:hypothetical protein